ncbi:hypothetical protein M404DRAFT_717976 [Pisolithus tinctorius Marx 270]|uniref:Uncharacterized protein n=1 Tax=Pisolithus tinctorius Marx 270 TaxID=870435 RepID=A0A0C3P3T1_PISTI|nr:hypothetical protein M404DRAFT_717976 [Pisolithus tinctorius Marx 270]
MLTPSGKSSNVWNASLLEINMLGVIAGRFSFVGADSRQGNGITLKLLYLMRDKSLTPADEPLREVRTSRVTVRWNPARRIWCSVSCYAGSRGNCIPCCYFPSSSCQNIDYPSTPIHSGRIVYP